MKIFAILTFFALFSLYYSLTQEINCGLKSGFCEECVKSSSKCYYCSTDRLCRPYPYTQAFPTLAGQCNLRDSHWATCSIPLSTIVIIGVVILSILLSALFSCLCCCCGWCCC